MAFRASLTAPLRQPAAHHRGGESLPKGEALGRRAHTWNATRLAEAVEEHFGVGVSPEAIRQHLLATGYRWKRTRYVPSRPPDPEEEREARAADLQGLERGPKKASMS